MKRKNPLEKPTKPRNNARPDQETPTSIRGLSPVLRFKPFSFNFEEKKTPTSFLKCKKYLTPNGPLTLIQYKDRESHPFVEKRSKTPIPYFMDKFQGSIDFFKGEEIFSNLRKISADKDGKDRVFYVFEYEFNDLHLFLNLETKYIMKIGMNIKSYLIKVLRIIEKIMKSHEFIAFDFLRLENLFFRFESFDIFFTNYFGGHYIEAFKNHKDYEYPDYLELYKAFIEELITFFKKKHKENKKNLKDNFEFCRFKNMIKKLESYIKNIRDLTPQNAQMINRKNIEPFSGDFVLDNLYYKGLDLLPGSATFEKMTSNIDSEPTPLAQTPGQNQVESQGVKKLHPIRPPKKHTSLNPDLNRTLQM